MLSLDSHMPFYGNDYFSAVDAQPEHIALGYIRVLWHYWSHNHCDGLRNDPDQLRRICRIEREHWPAAFPIIFGDFFKLDNDGLWQQQRCKDEYKVAVERYESAVSRGRIGAEKRWRSKP
jgi:uncharacterized protein YdaU (DUF1376 family)